MTRLLVMLATTLPAAAAESSTFGNGPSMTVAIFRMLGSLALVIALFFGAAWLFKNGPRLKATSVSQRKLQILEAKSLGARQAVYVVGYENQRMLIGSTANGLTLLTHLPEGTALEPSTERIVPVSFGEALMQALGRK
jgi:flagellar biogenesis protein FliO